MGIPQERYILLKLENKQAVSILGDTANYKNFLRTSQSILDVLRLIMKMRDSAVYDYEAVDYEDVEGWEPFLVVSPRPGVDLPPVNATSDDSIIENVLENCKFVCVLRRASVRQARNHYRNEYLPFLALLDSMKRG